MKSRYGVIVWSALVSLIGMSWIASRFGMSSWQLGGWQMGGMVVAGAFGIVGARTSSRSRTPAVLAFVASLPLTIGMLDLAPDFLPMARVFGVPFVVLVVGSSVASAAALFAVVKPRPPAKTDDLAKARTVR